MDDSSERRPRWFGWFPEFLRVRRLRFQSQVRLLGLSALVGLVAGVGAVLFYEATAAVEYFVLGGVVGYHSTPHPAGEIRLSWQRELTNPLIPWLLVVVPALGGLFTGWLVYTFAPEAEGHGTDAVIAAYHTKQGLIRPRVPIIKIIASAATLGTGGSGGREGPIAQIGAGFGSYLAGLLGLRPAERRVLLAAGMGAGIAAIFRAPLAGALFASEVLYRSPEFEPEVIMPAALASVVSYSTLGAVFGWTPLFRIPPLKFDDPWELIPYTLLVIWSVVLAALFTRSFYAFTRAFRRLPLRPHFRPAIGAALTGLTGVVLYYCFARNEQVLAVMAFGYSAIQLSLDPIAESSGWLLLAIALGKILTTGLTIGSGGSGGVFGPSMVIGGCGGAALGVLLKHWWPGATPEVASCALVGMAGFFAAAAKTPFSTLVIVSEMTGGYPLLLPALWVCVLSFMLSDEQSIYSTQVESRSRSPAHQGSYVREMLAGIRVQQFLTSAAALPLLKLTDTVSTVIDRLDDSGYPVLPVVDAEGRLLGIVDVEEVHLASQASEMRHVLLAADLMRSDVTPLASQDELDRAQALFVENDVLTLPVVDNLESRKVIGLVRRYEIASAYLRYLHGTPTVADAPRLPID